MFEDLIETKSDDQSDDKYLKCVLPNGTEWKTANTICDKYEAANKEKGLHGCKFFTDDYCCHSPVV